MKITDIKTLSVPHNIKNIFLVIVETDAGIYGLGEGGLSTRDLAMKGAVEHYRQWLIGRDPMKRGALWQEMYRSQYFEGGRALSAAISAIDMALYDITGKALGVPVYQLLGGKQRDYVDTFVTTGASSGPELIERTQRLIDMGWNTIRIVAADHGSGRNDERGPGLYEPRESIPLTAQWMTDLRQAVGQRPMLGVEYHHRLSVAEAASFCQRMPSGTLDFLEEPIRDETPEAYETLRTMTDVPFAIGEEFASKWQFLPYIERGITNFARVDLCNVGGITEAQKVAGWCEAHYINMMPHNPLGPVCTAATIHLSAAIANFASLEIWVDGQGQVLQMPELFTAQPQLEGTRFPVLDTPGLGVSLNPDYVEQPLRWSEFPHLHRRDGSHQNW